MVTGIILDREKHMADLKEMIHNTEVMYDTKSYLTLTKTVQLIEEIIYLNKCLSEDVKRLTHEKLEFNDKRVSSLNFLEEEK